MKGFFYIFIFLFKLEVLCGINGKLVALSSLPITNSASTELSKVPTEQRLKQFINQQAVEFLENKGQMKDMDGKFTPYIFFKAEAPGVDLYVGEQGLTYVFLKQEEEKREFWNFKKRDEEEKMLFERMDVLLKGAHILKKNIVKEEASYAYTNYLGPTEAESFYKVKKYKRVIIKEVYPGIDWVLYNSSKTGFKYDFIVHPGANSNQIELVYISKREPILGEDGSLQLKTLNGTIRENAPYSYIKESGAEIKGVFQNVMTRKKSGQFESHFKFHFPEAGYLNKSQTLVIDPQLVWSTFFGGSAFEGTTGITCDKLGNVYLTGYGASSNFPLLNSGAFYQSTPGNGFILKFNTTGVLLWATYFAGQANTSQLCTDKFNNLFLCGNSFPGLIPLVNAGTYFQSTALGSGDAYLCKFDPAGNILWSTYFGGSSTETGSSVSCDTIGNVFMTGVTTSTDFPLQNSGGYFDSNFPPTPNCYIAKFSNAGNLLWSTYFKGMISPIITTDFQNNVLLTGTSNSTTVPVFNPGGTTYFQALNAGINDVVIAKFNSSCQQLWTSYFGGTQNDFIYGIATDKSCNIFITGISNSTNLPVFNSGGYFQSLLTGTLSDVFVAKFSPNGTLNWSTYFGGTRLESMSSFQNMAIDSCGNCYVSFSTVSRNLPLQTACEGGFQKSFMDTTVSNNSDGFVARFQNNGQYSWGSYLGGDGLDFRNIVCIDKSQNIYISGEWCTISNSNSYPQAAQTAMSYMQGFSGGDDIYITKFSYSLPTQVFNYQSSYCSDDTDQVPILAPGFLSGGSFTSSPGLVINPVTGLISPSLSAAGIYTVNYSKVRCHCLGALPELLGSAVFTLYASPIVSISGNTSVCIGEKRTYTATGANSYTWNTTLQSNTLSISPTVSTTINYTVTGTANNGCKNKKALSVVVSKCTELVSYEMENSIVRVYPNPNSGEFNLSADKDIELSLYTELGQLVQHLSLSNSNGRTITVSGLAPGVYFLNTRNQTLKQNYKIIVTE